MTHKTVRLCIMVRGGTCASSSACTSELAQSTMKSWCDWVNSDDQTKVPKTLVSLGKDSQPVSCVLISEIVAMYIVDDKPTPTERVAEVMEKLHSQESQGNEWKGD